MQYKNLRKEYQNIDVFYCMQEKNERLGYLKQK